MPSIPNRSSDSELSEEEWSNALLDFMRDKCIRVIAEDNLFVREIIEKYKKLADKMYDGDDEDDKKGLPMGEICHVRSEDPSGIIYMDKGLGHGGHPTYTSAWMLHLDALQPVYEASMASL